MITYNLIPIIFLFITLGLIFLIYLLYAINKIKKSREIKEKEKYELPTPSRIKQLRKIRDDLDKEKKDKVRKEYIKDSIEFISNHLLSELEPDGIQLEFHKNSTVAKCYPDFIPYFNRLFWNIEKLDNGGDFIKLRITPMKIMNKSEFEIFFEEYHLPIIKEKYEKDGIPDIPARREEWNNTIDFMIKDNLLDESAGEWACPY